MVNSKQFYQDLREGQVEHIWLKMGINSGYIYLIWHHRNGKSYLLERHFLSFNSALNYTIKAIDKPIITGLLEQYQLPPSVEIIKLRRRSENETNQHEPTSKSEDLSEGQSCPLSE